MRHNAHTVKYKVPKTTKPNRPKPQKVRPVMGKTQSNRTAKTHVAGRMAGTIRTNKQKKFIGVTPDVRRLKKNVQTPPRLAVRGESQGTGGEKTYPVVVAGKVIGEGTIVKAKSWGGGRHAQNRCQVAIDGKVRGWARFVNGRLIIIASK